MNQNEDRNQVAESLEDGLQNTYDIANDAAKIAHKIKSHNEETEGQSPKNHSDSNGNSNSEPNNNGPSQNTPSKSGNNGSQPQSKTGQGGTAPGTPGPSGTPNSSSAISSASSGTGESAAGIAAGGETAGAASGAGGTVAGAAGSGASTAAGASSAAAAGGAAGSAAGPIGTAVGAGLGAVVSKFGKWVLIIILGLLFIIAGIMDELVPNIITKPVSTNLSTAKGVYEQAKSIIKGIVDFFSGENDERVQKIETIEQATQYCVDVIDEILESAYEDARAEVKKMCDEKGYDYETTLDSFASQGGIFNSTNYALIISTYSVTTNFTNVTVAEFKQKLRDQLKITYTVTEETDTKEEWDPVPIYKYEPITVKICVDEWTEEDEEGRSRTYHEYERYTIYERAQEVDKREDGTGYWISNREGEMVTNYVPATMISHTDHSINDVLDGKYVVGSVVGEPNEILIKPEIKNIKYGNITLIPYQNEDVYSMFGVDPDARYKEGYETTYRQMIEARMTMMEGLVNNILKTSHVNFATSGLTEQDIEKYMAALPAGLSGNRKQVIKTALSLVGMVPYYYGGKAGHTGWNDDWWTDAPPDHKGRNKKGLDCSGYVQWVFATAGFNNGKLDGSLLSTSSISNLQYITKEELQPGDIGLTYQGDSKHTGIYMGNDTWIHCSSSGTVVISPGYTGFNLFKRYKPAEMELANYYNAKIVVYSTASNWEYTGDVWYLITQVVYQECSTTIEGTIAVAESIRNRCLSPDFPNDPFAVVTAPKQFEAYGAGHYKTRTPTSEQIELVKQVLGGTRRILNDTRVLFFVSNSYHKANYLTGKSWLVGAGYKVFGSYGDNTYYYNPKTAKVDDTSISIGTSTGMPAGGISQGSGKSAITKQVPNNSSNNGIVYYGQGNSNGGSEWATKKFGGGTIATSGCSVTSLAMVISYINSGSNPSGWVYPNQVVDMIATKNKGNYNVFYRAPDGQDHSIMEAVAGYYGIKCNKISSNSIVQSLKAGKPVIQSCTAGEFTTKGHFIVITGIDEYGRCYVNDPNNSANSGKAYQVSELVNQGKAWWNFSK
jgi:cell wall-associated NlpC family hydrolase